MTGVRRIEFKCMCDTTGKSSYLSPPGALARAIDYLHEQAQLEPDLPTGCFWDLRVEPWIELRDGLAMARVELVPCRFGPDGRSKPLCEPDPAPAPMEQT